MSLRDRFKPIPTKKLKAEVEKENSQIFTGYDDDKITLEDGKFVKIRIMPALPGEENYYITTKYHWLTIMKEGKEARRKVPNAVVHGLQKTDVIDAYVEYATRFLKAKGEDDATAKIKALTAYEGGIDGSFGWTCWAKKVGDDDIKLWDFKKQVRDQLNELAMSEDDDAPVEVDPFTDPDTGKLVKVKYNSKPDKKKGELHYKVQLGDVSELSDDELEALMKKEPLSEKFRGNYTMEDFELSLEALELYDSDKDINLFEDEEWLAKVKQIKSDLEGSLGGVSKKSKETPKSTPSKTSPAPAKKATPAVVEEQDDVVPEEVEEVAEQPEGDELDDMDREELKRYIGKNGYATDVIVRKSMTDDDIREAIRTHVYSLQEAGEVAEEIPEEPEVEEVPTAPAKKMNLADLKKKLSGGK